MAITTLGRFLNQSIKTLRLNLSEASTSEPESWAACAAGESCRSMTGVKHVVGRDSGGEHGGSDISPGSIWWLVGCPESGPPRIKVTYNFFLFLIVNIIAVL